AFASLVGVVIRRTPGRLLLFSFFFTAPPPPELSTLSLHDALPIWPHFAVAKAFRGARTMHGCTPARPRSFATVTARIWSPTGCRSEEHTSELQSRFDLVCRLLLEKKKQTATTAPIIRVAALHFGAR